MEERTMQV